MPTAETADYSGLDELYGVEKCMPGYNRHIVTIFKAELHDRDKRKIADFGAGIGTLSLIYETLCGVRPDCVEIDPTNKKILKDRGLGVEDNIEDCVEELDGVFSSNVLEHIEDDEQALRSIYESLNPGGRLVLYLPAFQVLFSGLDEAVGHFRRYGKSDIASKCRRAGFRVERVRYCDSVGFFAGLAIKMLGYDPDEGLGSEKSLLFYDRVVFPVSRLIDALGMKYLFGKNIVVVASKPQH